MQEINSTNFGMTSELIGSDITEVEERRRECLLDNGNEKKRTNLKEQDKNRDALNGGYGDCSENRDNGYEIYEDKGKDLGGGAEAGGFSTFVEIPMAGVNRGSNVQTSSFQVSVGKGGAIALSEHVKCSRTQETEVPYGGIGFRNAEVAIQAGGIKLLIYGGVQETTLQTVMKVVMDYA